MLSAEHDVLYPSIEVRPYDMSVDDLRGSNLSEFSDPGLELDESVEGQSSWSDWQQR